ncbi:MAG: HAD-IIB family hydrolase [Minisyncoccia bacterium]|jgi:HAD superfamily hydrolase (TIGR01484 family)
MTLDGKELVVFDLDGTLSPSKFPMEPDMAPLIVRLLEKKKVAVISGSGYPMFETNFLNIMPPSSENFRNLVLLPTSGTRLLTWRGNWCEEYAEHLSLEAKGKIMNALNYALKSTGYERPQKVYGAIIEDRGSQITFSANGQNAPLEVKTTWDPTREKREKIAAVLRDKLPEFDIRIGGMNSIDVTPRGVNKAYGIRKLEEYFHLPIEKIVFVGDKLMYGGNDYPAKTTGVDCIEVSGPEETKELIRSWLGYIEYQ